MDKVQQRLDRMPNAMMVRKSTVEHVFGTLKHWMGLDALRDPRHPERGD